MKAVAVDDPELSTKLLQVAFWIFRYSTVFTRKSLKRRKQQPQTLWNYAPRAQFPSHFHSA